MMVLMTIKGDVSLDLTTELNDAQRCVKNGCFFFPLHRPTTFPPICPFVSLPSSPIDVVPLAGIYFTNTIHSLLFSHFLLFFSFMAFVLLHSEMIKQMLRAQRPEIVSVASFEHFSTNFHTNFLLYEHARTWKCTISLHDCLSSLL